MKTLSERVRELLEKMKPDRAYQLADLRALMPGAGTDTLREMMHELWVNRQIERVGDAAWRRHRSVSPHQQHASASSSRQTEVVKPEELFDHDAFADFFR